MNDDPPRRSAFASAGAVFCPAHPIRMAIETTAPRSPGVSRGPYTARAPGPFQYTLHTLYTRAVHGVPVSFRTSEPVRDTLRVRGASHADDGLHNSGQLHGTDPAGGNGQLLRSSLGGRCGECGRPG